MANAPIEPPKPYLYLVELWRGLGQANPPAVFLPNVSSFRDEPMVALHWDYALGPLPIEQSNGIVQRQISIRGHSGQKPSEATTVTTDPQGRVVASSATLDGPARFEAFMAFWEAFEAERKAFLSAYVQDEAQRPYLVLRILKTGKAYRCLTFNPIPEQSVGNSRSTYAYSLNILTCGDAKREPVTNVLNDPSKGIAAAETSTTSAVFAVTEGTNPDDVVDDVIPVKAKPPPLPKKDTLYVVPLEKILRDIPGDLAALRAPVTQFLGRIAEFQTLVRTAIEAGANLPRDIMADLQAFAQATMANVYAIADEFDATKRDAARGYMHRISTSMKGLTRSTNTLLAAAGTDTGPSRTAGALAPIPVTRNPSTAPVTTTIVLARGQTLRDVAGTYLGDSARWPEIVAANHMTNEFMMGDGRALDVGQVLKIPVVLPLGFQLRPDDTKHDYFGTDLKWDFQRRDFVPLGLPVRDIQSVSGQANLIQGATIRFTTVLGADQTAPDMGIPQTIGNIMGDTLKAQTASQIVQQGTADRRIRQVKDVLIRGEANKTFGSMTLVPIAGRSITLNNITSTGGV